MLCFSLSYLQLENFVLPPIGTTAIHRPTKLSSLNGIAQQQQQQQEQQQSVSSIKSAFNDEETTSNTAAAVTVTVAAAASQCHAEAKTMGKNTTDLRVQNGNESKCKLN